jgi:acetoin utilization deacetylase AcuC-like enzyme
LKKAKTGFVYSDIFLSHDTCPGHPEAPERLRAVAREVKRGLGSLLLPIDPAPAPLEWIKTVHRGSYIDELKIACERGDRFFHDPESLICRETYSCALNAAGGVLEAVDAVMDNRVFNAFCALRPPGHHGFPDRAMGFCFFNNAAIGARYAIERYGLKKVAIVDWDVHHGNATQEIFFFDPAVFYISIHQRSIFPGTGLEDEKGAAAGLNFNLNIPLDGGAADAEYLEVFERTVIPAIENYSPDLIIISAGFDAHADDPLGGMEVSSGGFGCMTRLVKDAAENICPGRIVSVLEGGYSLKGLSASVRRHLEALSGAY